MKATVYPGTPKGSVAIPPSKSFSHRAIICASLANGKSTISNVDYSDDILATIDCMRKLGAMITELPNGKDRKTLEVIGISDIFSVPSVTLDCGESGSTLRFLIPITGLSNQRMELLGHNRLLYRPQSIYQDIFKRQNLLFDHTNERILLKGPLIAGHYKVDGSISSQFISGLLFSLPLLDDDSTIDITLPYESMSYVDLTIQMLSGFGIHIEKDVQYNDHNNLISCRYIIPGKQHYQAAKYHVEGDYSQLAFFAVLGAINAPVTCIGVNHDSLQGDKAIISILEQCGADIQKINNGYIFSPGRLNRNSIDLQDCPDLGPILMILGMFSNNNLYINNTSRLVFKESDRVGAMVDGLRKLGVAITASEHDVVISKWQSNNDDVNDNAIEVLGYKDHRIVMSFAIAATKLNHPLMITDAQAIAKSYPCFFDDLRLLGIEVSLHD